MGNANAAKQGVLNLLTLLQACYTSLAAKRQLSILFSFISSPQLQPTDQICGLLGEADNATISRIGLVKPFNVADYRISSRVGGGYSLDTFPTVTVESPPPLGDKFRPAEARPIMKPTSRILRINVVDGGEGYSGAPRVNILGRQYERQCQAAAIISREGRVESVIVLDPGYGYGLHREVPPKVVIEPPKKPRGKQTSTKERLGRRAKAVADLEYEIVGVDIVSGGCGYVATEPPKVTITPPKEDPDWFIAVQELPELRMLPLTENYVFTALVTEIKFADGNVAFSTDSIRRRTGVDVKMIERIGRDPLEMLPSFVRPERLAKNPLTDKYIYSIPSLGAIPQNVTSPNPRYRAQDPVFGGIGFVPVTKGARALSTSEYTRLALSGAVCTVLVRTALNPLELVKTKQQLQNDRELFSHASRQDESSPNSSLPSSAATNLPPLRPTAASVGTSGELETETSGYQLSNDQKENLGPVGLLLALISLRGPGALFQSADITFLASLVFGSFGFGATELFRRSFSTVFFDEDSGSAIGNEITLLLAAALATVLTAAAASPFEVLRVRSMGLVENQRWTAVLQDYIVSGLWRKSDYSALLA